MDSLHINIDRILQVLNDCNVRYLLIGGANFLLRHKPVLTFDVDVWIEDTEENRRRCEKALVGLDAEWGRADADWRPAKNHKPGWLDAQSLFCLITPHGALDIFRNVDGLGDWQPCDSRAYEGKTAAGVPFRGLSDEDMLQAQYTLKERDRKIERIEYLKKLSAGEK